MNILYVSCLCSDRLMNELFDSSISKPNPAPQKFHSLLVKGLVSKGQNITSLVSIPVTLRSHPNRKWWRIKSEYIDGVRYIYIPFVNHPLLKLLSFKVCGFLYTLFWSLRIRGPKAMITDVLYAHSSGARFACQLLGIETTGIVTDIPGLMINQKKTSPIHRWLIKRDLNNIKKMSNYIVLTDAMCDIFNADRSKPYCVIEGLVDIQQLNELPVAFCDNKRHITYTGSLEERYGIRMLIEAFMGLPQSDIVLDLYGRGGMDNEIKKYEECDHRIHFHGMVSLEESVYAQKNSYLLVNPRPTNEDFTKYSFPSKNMEYMATGVPLLTSKLPGMPEEYFPFVYLFEDETIKGLIMRLNEILNMPEEEVKAKGREGKQFVMENKNNIRQAERVLELLRRY